MEKSYRNLMEEIVLENIDSVLEECGCCNCDICKTDVITYTLNHLPPKYVSTLKGELFSSIDMHVFQNAADIVFAMVQSAKRVKENPQHNKPQE